jgi:hypothetical protein
VGTEHPGDRQGHRARARVHHAIAKLAYAGYIVKGNGPRMLRLTNKEMT